MTSQFDINVMPEHDNGNRDDIVVMTAHLNTVHRDAIVMTGQLRGCQSNGQMLRIMPRQQLDKPDHTNPTNGQI